MKSVPVYVVVDDKGNPDVIDVFVTLAQAREEAAIANERGWNGCFKWRAVKYVPAVRRVR